MTVAEIIQITVGILSLIATVSVAFLIYWLQSKQDKQLREISERQDKEAIMQKAEVFLIENAKEIQYLPLCVIACSATKYRSQHRKIYSNFNKCSKELQMEILKIENIPITIQTSREWIDKCLSKFDKDVKLYKLGKSMLYDGAKYLHCAINNFSSKDITHYNTAVFKMPSLSRITDALNPDCTYDLTLYTDRYLEFFLRDREDTKDKPELLPQTAPLDLLYTQMNLGECSLADLNFWVMKSINAICIALFRHDKIKSENDDWRLLGIGDAVIETHEDMYYETLLNLFTAYMDQP